ncbi:hypothetical protein [Aeoliella mucimassa]|uniref:Transmembrane protein n=1 Tax=Aeoliella mucimassa TaxID=2527972 RepID=A0A518AHN9_9BACT|nr:hypothetical protein [Aeoliella mucimassa]QDU54249.1 hypothetical protein Pan181_04290 [Aeoliella mucimassa]
MRLTLRTLLAYMDDILDPADQENLAKQVASSENATELLHRTRDAMRRLRLGAPPVLGDGMDLDPNAAAEYLDSTMSADDMSEYQQVCLDSDVHLAEVASCHHILTMVLGEPAEIDPAMRERMYGIPTRVDEWRKLRLDAPHPMAGAATAEAEAEAPVETTPAPAEKVTPKSTLAEPHKSEVPDYLRASESSSMGRYALMFAAALLLGFGGFMLFGPNGMLNSDNSSETEVAQADANTPAPDAGTPAAPVDPEENVEPEVLTIDAPTVPGGPDELTPAPATEDEQDDFVLPVITGLDGPLEDPTPEAVVEEMVPVVEPADGDEAMVDSTPAIEVPPLEIPDTAVTPDVVVEETTIVEQPPVTDAADTTEPLIAMNPNNVVDPLVDPLVDPTADPSVDAAEMESATDEATEPAGPMPLGTVVTSQEVLLRWDEAKGAWLRLPTRPSIIEGDHLLSLPTYRPSLALASGALRVEMCDGANAVVSYGDDGKMPRIAVTYGRFLLLNTGMEPVEVELMIGDESKKVVMESTAVLALDVDRPFIPGADVENSLGAFHAMLYAPTGNLTWGTLPVATASQWEWHDAAPVALTDDAGWLEGKSLDYLEKNVSSSFEEQLDTERPARIQLLELFETSRRREDKALAATCATHVGQFVPFVQALADTQQQSNWDDHITQLRLAMSRSTQAAKLVHQTLTEQRGADLADDLFNMLRGYTPAQIGTTPDQVKSGITRQLIDWLEHDRLEYRVLAIHNLKQIYGGKTLGYNPVVTEPNRQQRAVKLWRTRLADNELVPGGR